MKYGMILLKKQHKPHRAFDEKGLPTAALHSASSCAQHDREECVRATREE